MRRYILVVALLVSFSSGLFADILKIEIDGVIHPMTAEFVKRSVAEASKRQASALLIELRTPGGLETSTREIVNAIVASRVPVIVWVTPSGSRAASAGFFILVAADVAAMSPGTNTGAAHPVTLGGEKIDDVMKAKLQNDSAAFIRSVAARRGRNVAVAESAVRESKSFTEDEALAQQLIDFVASDRRQLLSLVDGRPVKRWNGATQRLKLAGQRVVPYRMTMRERILNFLMDPNIAFLLFALGVMALYAEFNNPGAVLPGVIGLIAIVLAVFALNLLPTRFAALGLIVVAFILFALEAKFVSHGVFGVGGVICMILGALLLVDGPIPELRVNLITAIAVSVPFGIIAVFLMKLAYEAHMRPVTTGESGMIGEVGIARTELAPTGKVFVHGELWNAVASGTVTAGEQVRVVAVDGLMLRVEPAVKSEAV